MSVMLHLSFLATVLLCHWVLAGGVGPPVKSSVGSPWPLPASITITTDAQAIDVMLFHFKATAHSCDILEAAFVRYYRIMFHGQPFHKKYSAVGLNEMEKPLLFKSKVSNGGLTSFEVAVQQECEKWPSLEMDESCELLFLLSLWYCLNITTSYYTNFSVNILLTISCLSVQCTAAF